jgi:hypothetical protein
MNLYGVWRTFLLIRDSCRSLMCQEQALIFDIKGNAVFQIRLVAFRHRVSRKLRMVWRLVSCSDTNFLRWNHFRTWRYEGGIIGSRNLLGQGLWCYINFMIPTKSLLGHKIPWRWLDYQFLQFVEWLLKLQFRGCLPHTVIITFHNLIGFFADSNFAICKSCSDVIEALALLISFMWDIVNIYLILLIS